MVPRRFPDRVPCPDALFINEWLPIRRSPDGFLETIPDPVVGVKSKSDSRAYIEQKIADYLATGIHVVWIADPETKTVIVHRSAAEPPMLLATETPTIEDVVPGLAAVVGEGFVE